MGRGRGGEDWGIRGFQFPGPGKEGGRQRGVQDPADMWEDKITYQGYRVQACVSYLTYMYIDPRYDTIHMILYRSVPLSVEV